MSRSIDLVSALFAPVAGVVANASTAVVKAWTLYRNRRAVRELLAFDDRMLADIGLMRGDVTAALSGPATVDPSTRLRILAVERRAGSRAQRREALAETHPQTGARTVAPLDRSIA
ncbi:MAG: DUF1127 domain-containing protein [Siculibacillus sp.]